MAIFILAILLSLVVSVAQTSRTDLKASTNFRESVQDDAMLDGAINYAMGVLQNDADAGQDSLEDDWATQGEATGTPTPLGEGSFQFQILDAGSRLNLNTATRDQIMKLPGMTDDITDAILDWRDTDDNPGSQGAESDTYQSYPRPYLAKNGPFDTLDELLMVQGMTPGLLYGDPTQLADQSQTPPDPTVLSSSSGIQPALADLLTVRSYERNENASGTARLNLSQVTQQQLQDLTDVTISAQQAQAIVQRRNQNAYQSVADLLDVQGLSQETVKLLVDDVTVSSAKTLEGRINVNTALADVLNTIPNLTEETINNIISNRPYKTIGDLLDDSIVPAATFRQIVNFVCTKSSMFLIRVRVSPREGGMMKAAEALVERTPEGMKLLRREEVNRWPGWATWNWTTDQQQTTMTAPAGS